MESLHTVKWPPLCKKALCALFTGLSEGGDPKGGRKGKAPIHKSHTPPPFPEINSGEVINREGEGGGGGGAAH